VSYVERRLISGETILYRTGLHWIVLFSSGILALLFILVGIFLLVANLLFFGLIVIALSAPIMAIAVIARNSTEMAVTNKRVIIKTGWLRRKTIEVFLSKIESIDVDQSIFARMLGYGTIIVKGTGGSKEPFDRVRSPLEFRRQVQQFTVV
jgi:uncharacterized membrane protein YdbT with pleckstrin-like domain